MRCTRMSATGRATSPRTTCRCARPACSPSSTKTASRAWRSRAADGRAHEASPDRRDRVGGQTAIFVADLLPTAAHVPLRGSWATTCIRWRRWSSNAVPARSVEREYLMFFEHDPDRWRPAASERSTKAAALRESRRRWLSASHIVQQAAEPETGMQAEIGIIGGSGLYDMAELTDREEVRVDTPFGDPSGPYVLATLRGRRVAFLARHGAGHRIMPVRAQFPREHLRVEDAGRRSILSASAVGSLKEEYKPLDIVVPDQFFDRTKGRISTFFGRGLVAHVGFAHPICGDARRIAADAGERSARRCTAAARTCAWKARSSRRWPNRSSIARGAWTSSG